LAEVNVVTGEVEEMLAFGKALIAAAAIERDEYHGMDISVIGTLTHAARSLREMAVAMDTRDSDATEEHEARCNASQPTLRAFALEELARHMTMVKAAVEGGDLTTVRQFFAVHKFD
jgi:hypothetical protein